MRINNNITAMRAYTNLSNTNIKTGVAMEKLSAGVRINSVSDDPAGMAISNKLRMQIRGLELAERNAMDGVSIVQTAEGALQEIQNMIQRIRELAVASSNDTNELEDRQAMMKEAADLLSEIDGVVDRTEFNNIRLLGGGVARLTRSSNPDIAKVVSVSEGVSNISLDFDILSVGMPAHLNQNSVPATTTADFSTLPQDGYINVNGVVIRVTEADNAISITAKLREAMEATNIVTSDKDFDWEAWANGTIPLDLRTKDAGSNQTINIAGTPAILTAMGLPTTTSAIGSAADAAVAAAQGTTLTPIAPATATAYSNTLVDALWDTVLRVDPTDYANYQTNLENAIADTSTKIAISESIEAAANAIAALGTYPDSRSMANAIANTDLTDLTAIEAVLTGVGLSAADATTIAEVIYDTAFANIIHPTNVTAIATAAKAGFDAAVAAASATAAHQAAYNAANVTAANEAKKLGYDGTPIGNAMFAVTNIMNVTEIEAAILATDPSVSGADRTAIANAVVAAAVTAQNEAAAKAAEKARSAYGVTGTDAVLANATLGNYNISYLSDGNRIEIKGAQGETVVIDLQMRERSEQTIDFVYKVGNTLLDASQSQTGMSIEFLNFGMLKMQIGPNKNQEMAIEIPNISTKALGLTNVNLGSVHTSQQAITLADKALSLVSHARSKLGAYQNRLDYTSNSLSAAFENTSTSLSRILDTDMAWEMTNLTQNQVLAQAGTSILAQANKRPEQVLQLLG